MKAAGGKRLALRLCGAITSVGAPSRERQDDTNRMGKPSQGVCPLGIVARRERKSSQCEATAGDHHNVPSAPLG
jgi:hypothetical protein